MFPILDRNNRVIAFGGRVMGDAKPKYLNSPETMVFDKSRNLYGLNFVHGKQGEGMIICEGYMDVLHFIRQDSQMRWQALVRHLRVSTVVC